METSSLLKNLKLHEDSFSSSNDGTADGTAGDGTGGGRDQLIRTREAGAVLGGSH